MVFCVYNSNFYDCLFKRQLNDYVIDYVFIYLSDI
nr:MAG TPA: hypothetical protein [Caudoviricetes sp.]